MARLYSTTSLFSLTYIICITVLQLAEVKQELDKSYQVKDETHFSPRHKKAPPKWGCREATGEKYPAKLFYSPLTLGVLTFFVRAPPASVLARCRREVLCSGHGDCSLVEARGKVHGLISGKRFDRGLTVV